MASKMIFCSEFPDIRDKTGRIIRRGTEAITKRFAFHANAKNQITSAFIKGRTSVPLPYKLGPHTEFMGRKTEPYSIVRF